MTQSVASTAVSDWLQAAERELRFQRAASAELRQRARYVLVAMLAGAVMTLAQIPDTIHVPSRTATVGAAAVTMWLMAWAATIWSTCFPAARSERPNRYLQLNSKARRYSAFVYWNRFAGVQASVVELQDMNVQTAKRLRACEYGLIVTPAVFVCAALTACCL